MPLRIAPQNRLSLIFFALAALCTLSPFVALKTAPPYFDYDSATEGIFINNLIFRGSFDYYFRDSAEPQDIYRRGYAAYRLPLSYPLSLLHRVFADSPDDVELFLKIVGGIGFLSGSIFAALLFQVAQKRLETAAFVVGGTLVYPPILLGSRSGIMFWGVLYALYWGTLYLVVRALVDRRPVFLYLAGVLVGYLAVNLWTNLPTLPLALLFFLAMTRRLGVTLRSPHTYGALLTAILTVVLIYSVISAALGWTFHEYWSLASWYPFERRNKISLLRWLDEPIAPKLLKTLNQQLLFMWDTLGDPYRPDHIYTLGVIHPVWLVLAMVALSGFVLALWRREEALFPHIAVVAAVSLFFLMFSFPEGRYLLIVAPTYFVFIDYAFRSFAVTERMGTTLRLVSLGALGAVTTFLLVTRYSPEIERRMGHLDGMREIAAALNSLHITDGAMISLPHRFSYGDWLYFSMLTNFTPHWVPEPVFRLALASDSREPKFFVTNHDTAVDQPRQGFKLLTLVRSADTGQHFEIWRKTHRRPRGRARESEIMKKREQAKRRSAQSLIGVLQNRESQKTLAEHKL